MGQYQLLKKAFTRILLVANFLSVTGARVIYVGQTNASDDNTCGQVPSFPCHSLNTALGQVTSSTTVVIDRGEYPLHSNTNLSFDGVRNVTLQGRSGSEPEVRVTCDTGAGLSFFNSRDITIENIEFYGCGVLHPSTNRNYSDSTSFSFLNFRSALYFLFCENVNFERVTVTHSHGTGLTLYSTAGDNAFQSCNFSYNRADPGYPGGGGVYIEFLVCVPGKPEECSNHSSFRNALLNNNSNAHYTFNDTFLGFNDDQNVQDTKYTFLAASIYNHITFGHGGGIMVYFWNVQNSSVVVSHSEIVGNVAYWGGGVQVEFLEECYSNSFEMHSTIIKDNRCQYGADATTPAGTEGAGGGIKLGYNTYDKNPSSYNSLLFVDCTFCNNSAYWGGGGTFKASPEFGRTDATNVLEFVDCLWSNNVATIAAAMELTVWNFAGSGALAKPVFTNCTFQNNSGPQDGRKIKNKYVGTATVLADDVSVVFKESVVFADNKKTALVVENAFADFLPHCTANFTNNLGRNGGAVGLWGYAYVRVDKYAKMFFINNSAWNYGGAIQAYSLGEHGLVGKDNCFIQYRNSLHDPTTLFYFENNYAKNTGRGYNSISAVSLWPCLSTTQISGNTTRKNTKLIFCDDNWKFVGENSSCTNEIVTAPAYFNTSSSYHMEVIPGKGEVIPLETYDDKGNLALDRTVLKGWSYSPYASFFSNSLYISDHTIHLKGRPNSKVTIGLETVDPRAIYTEVEVTLLPCPAGLKPDDPNANLTTCVCAGSFGGTVHCDPEDFQSTLRRGYWIGSYNRSGENPIEVVGLNPYTSKAMHGEYSPLPKRLSELDATLCAPSNRTGILCGDCLPNHGIVANSRHWQCIPCSENMAKYGWVFYLLEEFVPITIFLVIILVFHINVTSGPANGFVFFAQALTATFAIDGDGTIPLSRITKSADALQHVFLLPYSIWNLNFFRDIFPPYCLSPHLDTLGIIAIDYLTAAYPLVLIIAVYIFLSLYDMGGVIYTICNPIHKCLVRCLRKWNLNKRSVVDAFATFLVLSYTKFTLISLTILKPGELLSDDDTPIAHVVFHSGNTGFLHGKHIPLFILALFVLIVFVIIPPLLLLLYPLREMYLRWKVPHSTSSHSSYRLPTSNTRDWTRGRLNQFLQTFYGCYKDGLVETTDGGTVHKPTRDYRYFAGVYFLLRMVLFVIYTFTSIWAMHYILQQMICIIAILLFAILRPYKNRWYNNLDATMFGLLAIINTLSLFNTYLTAIDTDPAKWVFAVQYVLIFCPLVYMTGYVLRFIWKMCHARRSQATTETTGILYIADSKVDRSQLDREFLEYYHDIDAERRDRHVNYYPPKPGNLEETDSQTVLLKDASDSGLADGSSSHNSAY